MSCRCLSIVLLLIVSAVGEDPKPEKPVPPSALLAIPFVIERGKTTTCVIRGQSLDMIEKITSAEGISVSLTSKAEAKLPDGWKPEKLGDRQVTCEITVNESFPAEATTASLTLTHKAGETVSIDIAVANTLVDEKEPNPGFDKSQPIETGQNVSGIIGSNKDVDVFHLDAEAGAVISAKVTARQRGSALDPILALYDSNGFERARSDDSAKASRDAALRLTIPTSGRYFFVLQDAHDTGSEAHVYQLHVTTE
jgi:hypothetical protein